MEWRRTWGIFPLTLVTWQSLFRVKFSHELFEETLFSLHCLTCTIDTLTSGSSTQVMIVRSQNKSFITGVDNLHAGKLMCLPTRYTSINTDKYVCVYIHIYVLNYRCTETHILRKGTYSIVPHIIYICYKIHPSKYANSSSSEFSYGLYLAHTWYKNLLDTYLVSPLGWCWRWKLVPVFTEFSG